MENKELKVGMYVRAKIDDFNDTIIIRKIAEIYKEGTNRICLDDIAIDDFYDVIGIIGEEAIELASENLIDLIKPGDYVNGEKVQFITNKRQLLSEGGYDILEKYTGISSIVTKEQFEVIAYEVKKDENRY